MEQVTLTKSFPSVVCQEQGFRLFDKQHFILYYKEKQKRRKRREGRGVTFTKASQVGKEGEEKKEED